MLARCALGGDPGADPGYAAIFRGQQDRFYFSSATPDVRDAVPALNPDPCGQLASIPTALGATGGSARHSMVMDTAMRPMFAYLKAQVVPTGVFAASEDWGSDSGLDRRIATLDAEFAEQARTQRVGSVVIRRRGRRAPGPRRGRCRRSRSCARARDRGRGRG